MEKVCYGVEDLNTSLLNLSLGTIQAYLEKLRLEEAFVSMGDMLGESLARSLDARCQTWGMQILRVEVQGFLEPPPGVLAVLKEQASAAYRTKFAKELLGDEEKRLEMLAAAKARAIISEAEAESKCTVLLGQASAERLRVEAEGCDSFIKRTVRSITAASGTSGKDAVQMAIRLLMFSRYMEAQGKLASSNSTTKVVMQPQFRDLLPQSSDLDFDDIDSILEK